MELESVELTSDQASPEQVESARQTAGHLAEAIERLPQKCKRVFLLNRIQGMTYREISQHCGISVKMVEKHISRALDACSRELKDQD